MPVHRRHDRLEVGDNAAVADHPFQFLAGGAGGACQGRRPLRGGSRYPFFQQSRQLGDHARLGNGAEDLNASPAGDPPRGIEQVVAMPRENNDGNPGMHLRQPVDDIDAVLPAQPEIQQDEVGKIGREGGLEGGDRPMEIDRMAVPLEKADQDRLYPRIVVKTNQTHHNSTASQ